jgi:hypothetical protein
VGAIVIQCKSIKSVRSFFCAGETKENGIKHSLENPETQEMHMKHSFSDVVTLLKAKQI